jgi:putative transposase
MSRGNAGQWIFDAAEDWSSLLCSLEEAVDRYRWIIHGYSLLNNHYHLLVETPRGNLSIGMRHINGAYATRFNRSRDRVGHVFQGRFKSVLIEKDAHLLETIRYLALNPVRTEKPLCERPEQWQWGSYRAALGLAARPPWLNCDWTLAQFGPTYQVARARLKRFVDSALADEAPAHRPAGIYFGSEPFIQSATANLTQIPEIPRSHWQPLRPELERIFATSPEPLLTAYHDYGYTLRELAEHLDCHYATVSRHLRRAERSRSGERERTTPPARSRLDA